MSLINCPECGKTFSDKASACPNCGCPIEAIICADEPKKAQVNNQKNIPYSLSVKEIIKRADVFFKTKDYAGAFPLYKQAAELGNASAQVAVGNYFLNGWQPVKPDYKIAKEWFEKAADRNNAVAWNQLGSMYSSGKGVPVDKKKALDCFEKAASFGHALAASNAGVMYHMGSGTEVIIKKHLIIIIKH